MVVRYTLNDVYIIDIDDPPIQGFKIRCKLCGKEFIHRRIDRLKAIIKYHHTRKHPLVYADFIWILDRSAL